jgi:hypothetical protein
MAGKDVGLRIRVERTLRDEFLEACRAQDRPAAQIIREFMRSYVAQQSPVVKKRTRESFDVQNLHEPAPDAAKRERTR